MKIKSIKYNFFMNVLSTVTNLVFPLITYPYISRILSAEGLGKVSFATSIASYFIMFACLGIPTYGVRECAKVRDDKDKLSAVVQELLTLNILITIGSIVVFFILTISIPSFYEEKELMFLNIIYVFLNTLGINWLYTSLEQYTYITIRSILIKIISFFAIFLLIKESTDYIIYASISIIAISGSNIFNLIHAKKYVDFSKSHKFDLLRHMKPVTIFFIQSATLTLSNNIDTTILGVLSSNTQVGLYTTAIRVKSILLSVINSLSWVLVPRMTYFLKNKMKEDFIIVSYKVVIFIFITSIPLICFFVIYANDTILILAGNDFYGAIIPMQIIMFTLFFQGLSNMFGTQMLTPLGKESFLVKTLIIGVIVGLVLDITFISNYGAVGAAIANLGNQIVVLVIQYIYLRKIIPFSRIKESIIKIFISSIIASIITLLTTTSIDINLLINFTIKGMLFFGVYIITMIFFKEKYLMNEIYTILKK